MESSQVTGLVMEGALAWDSVPADSRRGLCLVGHLCLGLEPGSPDFLSSAPLPNTILSLGGSQGNREELTLQGMPGASLVGAQGHPFHTCALDSPLLSLRVPLWPVGL